MLVRRLVCTTSLQTRRLLQSGSTKVSIQRLPLSNTSCPRHIGVSLGEVNRNMSTASTQNVKPRGPNRLAQAKSPYLLQHAENPVCILVCKYADSCIHQLSPQVDWYEWGTDAFEKARLENKPIFLSVRTSCRVQYHTLKLSVTNCVFCRLGTPRVTVRAEETAYKHGDGFTHQCIGCHVLAHESFEDEVTAKLMNEHYVNIKV